MTKSPDTDNGYTRIAHEILEALARTDLTGGERRCLDVIFRRTYGHQKKEDWISFGQFQKMTGIGRRYIIDCIGGLEKKKIINIRREPYVSHYSFNKHHSQWGSALNSTSALGNTSVVQSTSEPDRTSALERKEVVRNRAPTIDNITKDTKVVVRSDINLESSERVADATTPAEYAIKFFARDKNVMAAEVGFLMSRGALLPIVRREFVTFCNYWMELTPGGKKQRWQTQKTFEIRRRLVTWFDRIVQQHSKNAKVITRI